MCVHCYHWNWRDTTLSAKCGQEPGVTYSRVIQKPDAYGGYNASFDNVDHDGLWHVHFNRGGLRIKVIRYKSSADAEGNNVVKYRDGAEHNPLSFADLKRAAEGWPVHQLLLQAFRESVREAERTAAQELE